MSIQRIVGLHVFDDSTYKTYREKMTPILKTYGGGFAYDFKIEETLQNESGKPINRLFVIYFKDEDALNEFFSNPQYLEIKQEFFEKSVDSTVEIGRYLSN
ncbi:MAG: DUF1330 domain-containing protein [Arcobacteraceae bacterium]